MRLWTTVLWVGSGAALVEVGASWVVNVGRCWNELAAEVALVVEATLMVEVLLVVEALGERKVDVVDDRGKVAVVVKVDLELWDKG